MTRLYNQKKATAEEYEKAQAGHKKASARVAALEAAVKLMKANIDEIKATIVTMHLYAPFDGTVVEKQGEVGEIISPTAMSSSLGRTAVVTIADLRQMDVETDISEAQLWRIAIGPAGVGLGLGDSVEAIPRPASPDLADERPNSQARVKVKVEILDPDDNLFPELAATVHFLPERVGQQPGCRQDVPVRAQVGRVQGERPRLRLGRSRPTTSYARTRSRSRLPPKTWRGSSRGSNSTRRSS